jgi:hypothetical protein
MLQREARRGQESLDRPVEAASSVFAFVRDGCWRPKRMPDLLTPSVSMWGGCPAALLLSPFSRGFVRIPVADRRFTLDLRSALFP